jgi:hypothetical protein
MSSEREQESFINNFDDLRISMDINQASELQNVSKKIN